jgi:hypothetical protein
VYYPKVVSFVMHHYHTTLARNFFWGRVEEIINLYHIFAFDDTCQKVVVTLHRETKR